MGPSAQLKGLQETPAHPGVADRKPGHPRGPEALFLAASSLALQSSPSTSCSLVPSRELSRRPPVTRPELWGRQGQAPTQWSHVASYPGHPSGPSSPRPRVFIPVTQVSGRSWVPDSDTHVLTGPLRGRSHHSCRVPAGTRSTLPLSWGPAGRPLLTDRSTGAAELGWNPRHSCC